jgi:hypothetical protein
VAEVRGSTLDSDPDDEGAANLVFLLISTEGYKNGAIQEGGAEDVFRKKFQKIK